MVPAQEKSKSKSPFIHLEEKARNIYEQWNDVYRGICEGKKESSSFDKKRFSSLDTKVEKAFKQLQHDIKNPTLILATTGTTSSGKSTIINLLCGADIMPRMSQEMSAGAVNIKHSHEGKRYLKVHKTKGALWDCGEWCDMSDKEIKDKLTKVMDTFNANKGENQPDTPIIDLTFPIEFFNNSDLLGNTGIPKNTIFKLMDLPGLRNHRDQTNAKVIENCRHALCLVAYDMQETDESKRTKLVEEVLQQIKYMGGSPVRMMFVLNRIDVFLKDDDPERRQQEMIAKVQKEIRNTLYEELPEHRESLANLSYSRLSSLPALHALKIKNNSDRNHEAEELESAFQKIIGKEIIRALPREVTDWEEEDFDRVSDAAWKNSHAGEFFDNLNEHIDKHFYTLVFPSIVENFKKEVEDAIGEASRTAYSVMQSSEKAYNEAITDLENQDKDLHDLFKDAESELKAPLNDFLSIGQKSHRDFEFFIQELHSTKIYCHSDYNKILPLTNWYSSLKRVQEIFEVVRYILEGEELDFSDTIFGGLPNYLQNKMLRTCHTYTSLKNSTTESELKKGVGYFYDGINEIIAETISILAEVENRRIHETMDYLMEQYLDYLQDNINKIAPEWKLYLGRHILSSLTPPALIINRISGTVENKSREERIWWSLFLKTETIHYTALPSPETIHKSGSSEIAKQLSSLCEPFSKMILDSFEEVNQIALKSQESILNDFNHKLEEAHKEHSANKDKIESYWEPLHNKTEALDQLFKDLI